MEKFLSNSVFFIIHTCMLVVLFSLFICNIGLIISIILNFNGFTDKVLLSGFLGILIMSIPVICLSLLEIARAFYYKVQTTSK